MVGDGPRPAAQLLKPSAHLAKLDTLGGIPRRCKNQVIVHHTRRFKWGGPLLKFECQLKMCVLPYTEGDHRRQGLSCSSR